METTKGRPRTASQYVAEVLRSELLNNTIKAGTRLRQEEISKRLGVSATPVREALKLLTAEGLILFDTHKGAVAKTLTLEELNEIYELRALLEEKLLLKALPNLTDEDIADASKIQKNIAKCENLKEWTTLNGLFHTRFWQNQKGSHLYTIVENLTTASSAYIALSLHYLPSHIKFSNETHEALIEAFKKRDKKEILKLHIEHLKDTQKILTAAFDDSGALKVE